MCIRGKWMRVLISFLTAVGGGRISTALRSGARSTRISRRYASTRSTGAAAALGAARPLLDPARTFRRKERARRLRHRRHARTGGIRLRYHLELGCNSSHASFVASVTTYASVVASVVYRKFVHFLAQATSNGVVAIFPLRRHRSCSRQVSEAAQTWLLGGEGGAAKFLARMRARHFNRAAPRGGCPRGREAGCSRSRSNSMCCPGKQPVGGVRITGGLPRRAFSSSSLHCGGYHLIFVIISWSSLRWPFPPVVR